MVADRFAVDGFTVAVGCRSVVLGLLWVFSACCVFVCFAWECAGGLVSLQVVLVSLVLVWFVFCAWLPLCRLFCRFCDGLLWWVFGVLRLCVMLFLLFWCVEV